MNPITECKRCSDCAMGSPGEPVQAVEACEVDVSGRVGYGTEVLD